MREGMRSARIVAGIITALIAIWLFFRAATGASEHDPLLVGNSGLLLTILAHQLIDHA